MKSDIIKPHRLDAVGQTKHEPFRLKIQREYGGPVEVFEPDSEQMTRIAMQWLNRKLGT